MRRNRLVAGALAGLFSLVLGALSPVRGQTPAAEIPPKPTAYFTDTAGVVDAATGAALNAQLEQFERQTSNQFIVYIAPKLPADEEIAPYATDVAQSWGVGTKRDNGAVLFVFPQDHKVWIATGRGINGALTDATCAEIIRNEIVPRFKADDFSGGVQAGVNAMLAAAQHEYKGNGTTVADQNTQGGGLPIGVIIGVIVFLMILSFFSRGGGGFAGPLIFTSGGWGGGGGFSGGGGGGGGGGGFSGGGGGFDGGGAGGSW